MAEATFREVVKTGQTVATVTCAHNKTGLRWIVWQLSVESSPLRASAEVTSVKRNGRYLTSSIVVPSSAQGPPAIALEGGDVLEVLFGGLVATDQAIVTLWYEEVLSGELGTAFGLV